MLMRSGRGALAALAATLLMWFASHDSLAQGRTEPRVDFAPNRVIVKFKRGPDNQTENFKNSLRAALRVSRQRHLALIDAEVWDLNGDRVEDVVARWQGHPRIEYIEPDYIVRSTAIPNDPLFPSLWGMTMIQAPQAWDLTPGANLVVGVIDSGVDYNHPDLAANIWTNPNEIPGNAIDDDSNGYIDDVHGYDFFNNDGDPMDDNSHGTHVAGTIAAAGNNGVGVVGVNPNARIMALKFLGSDGSGSTGNAIRAVQYATQMGAQLTNNSWGGGGSSQAMYDAIRAAGAANRLFVASAGNDGAGVSGYPARHDLDNIISVAATDASDTIAWFSNYNATSVDLGAPGVNILSTVPGNQYASFNGTSMASPHVAGVAALIWSVRPTLSFDDVKAIILASIDPNASLAGKTVTGGRLNAYSAVTLAQSWAPLEPPSITTSPSTVSIALDPDANANLTLSIGNQSDGRALLWGIAPPVGCSWLSLSTRSGRAGPGETSQVQLTFNTFAMSAGQYDCTLTISSNDPATPVVEVPVSLTVNLLPPPIVVVAPTSLSVALETGESTTRQITISNEAAAGARNLHWQAALQGPNTSWVSINLGAGVLAPQASQTVVVSFNAFGLTQGLYQRTLRITGNDGSSVDVPLEQSVSEAEIGGQQLYIANSVGKSIQRTNLTGSTLFTVQTGLDFPSDVAVDEVNRKVYWADGSGTISRSNVDGTEKETFLSGLGGVSSIALDFTNNHIYWMQYFPVADRRIRRANLDGTGVVTVVATPGQNTNSLALDIGRGKLYWTEGSPRHGVWQANFDGSGSVKVIDPPLGPNGFPGEPRGLALDLVNQKLYWGERNPNDALHRANLDGSGDAVVMTGFAIWDLALDLGAGKMYFNVWTGDDYAISRSNLDGTDIQPLNRGGIAFALDLTAPLPSSTTTTVLCDSGPFTYTGAAIEPCTATVTSSDGLNQTLTVSYTNNVDAGTATASASYAGDAMHKPSSRTATFTIDKASSATVVTFEPGPYVYRGTPFTATARVMGAGGLDASSPVTYTGDCTNVLSPNSCTASASYAGDANHEASDGTTSITITRAASATVLSCATGPFTYTGSAIEPCTATVTGVGGLNQPVTVTYTANVNTGTATATAIYAESANHLGSSASASFTIGIATSITVVSCPAVVPYTGAAIEPCTATVSGPGLTLIIPVSYSNNVALGTAHATASYPGDGNHTGSAGEATFVIRPRDALVRYIGQLQWMMAGKSSTSPQVTLSASAQDPTGSPLVGATMDFINAATNETLASRVPVHSVAGSPDTGTANVIVTLRLRSGISSVAILVKMSGNYSNADQAPADKTALLTTTSDNGSGATGAGEVAAAATAAGTLRSDIGAPAAFTIDLEDNKGGAVKGHITLAIPTSDGTIYVTSNAVSSMGAGSGNAITIYAKASISKVTNTGNKIAIDGGATLRVDLGDGPDAVGFTVLSSKNSELLYSNNWVLDNASNSWRTVPQGVASGDVTIK